MKQCKRFLLHAVTLDVHRLLASYMLGSCSLRTQHITSKLLEGRSTQRLGACIRSMLSRVDVFEMHHLMRNLFDHEINSNQEMLDSFRISAILARERDETRVIDVKRCGMQLSVS